MRLFASVRLLAITLLLSVASATVARADVIFWTQQGERLAGNVVGPNQGLIGIGQGLIRDGVTPALVNGNPYVQLDTLVSVTRATTLNFDPSQPAGYMVGRNSLIWGQAISGYDQIDVLLHEMRHGTQEFFGHPSALRINITDPIHTAFAEIDGCLAKYGGDVSSSMTCAIGRYGYAEIGLQWVQLNHPDLNDMQAFGLIRHMSTACQGPIMSPSGALTECGLRKYDEALRVVSDPNFSLSQADLIVPGGETRRAGKKLLGVVSAVSNCPGAKYLPVAGVGASLFVAQEAWAQGNYEAAIVEGCTNIPVVGDLVVTPAQIVGDYLVAPACEWIGLTDWLADILVNLYDTGESDKTCTVIYKKPTHSAAPKGEFVER